MKTQREIFDQLALRFKTKAEMYEYVANQFSVSTDAVSKWSYGTTMLSYDRLQLLVEHFGLSPDYLFRERPDWVYFVHTPLDMANPQSYSDYIQGFAKSIELFIKEPDVFLSSWQTRYQSFISCALRI